MIEFNDGRNVDEEKFLDKRNGRLLEFFERRGIPVHLKGNLQNPMIVINEGLILSASIKNFNLVFWDQPIDGQVGETIKMTYDNIRNYPTKHLIEILNRYPQIPGYRIKYIGTDLMIVGYAHSDRDDNLVYDKEKLYPVFGTIRPHVYKTSDPAIEVIEKLKAQGWAVSLDQYRGIGS